MNVAVGWTIATTGTVAAFGVTAVLPARAGADKDWVLGLGGLAGTLTLAILQAWATGDRRPEPPPDVVAPRSAGKGAALGLGAFAGTVAFAGRHAWCAWRRRVDTSLQEEPDPAVADTTPQTEAVPEHPFRTGIDSIAEIGGESEVSED